MSLQRPVETLNAEQVEEFMRLFSHHQRRIYLYILALVSNPVDAEDLLQETNLILWRKFPQWERGTNFYAWASRIVYYEVLKYRERQARDAIILEQHVIEQLAAEATDMVEQLDRRRSALLHCLSKLRPVDQELVQRRYAPGATGKSVAAALGRPANSVSKSLGRIRRALWECINRRLALGDAEGGAL